MPYKDPEKRRQAATERSRRLRARKRGPDWIDGRGRHGNHARGEEHPRWQGGRYISSHGYVLVKVPEGHHLRQAHGYAYEHDLVAEQTLGRRLEPTEIVHHLNEVKTDNRPENLQVMDRTEHAHEHNPIGVCTRGRTA